MNDTLSALTLFVSVLLNVVVSVRTLALHKTIREIESSAYSINESRMLLRRLLIVVWEQMYIGALRRVITQIPDCDCDLCSASALSNNELIEYIERRYNAK